MGWRREQRLGQRDRASPVGERPVQRPRVAGQLADLAPRQEVADGQRVVLFFVFPVESSEALGDGLDGAGVRADEGAAVGTRPRRGSLVGLRLG